MARLEDLDLPVVETEAPVDRGDLRLERALVRQQDAGRAALDDRRRDDAAVDVGERLGGEDDAGILLPERLQPFAKLAGEARIVEGEPALVDDEQGRPTVEAILDAVEQIGEHRRRGAGADQALGLEGLDVGLAEALGFGIEQPAPGAADAYRAGAPASARCDCSSTERPVMVRSCDGRGGKRGQRRP